MIKGLETHNAALVKAAADGFHANAADVSGNNVPLNGGTYNPDGTTIADALSTATAPLPPAPVSLLTPATPAAASTPAAATTPAAPSAPAAPSNDASDPDSSATAPPAVADAGHHSHGHSSDAMPPQFAHHHFEHMWT